MKKALANNIDVLSIITQLQMQLTALDKKVDVLLQRPISGIKPVSSPNGNPPSMPAKLNDFSKGRMSFIVICADCKKECTIPFKPTGDRPVYCKDCFSRRRVISLSGMKVDDKPTMGVPTYNPVIKDANVVPPQAKLKTKALTGKKTVVKKKSVVKKNKR